MALPWWCIAAFLPPVHTSPWVCDVTHRHTFGRVPEGSLLALLQVPHLSTAPVLLTIWMTFTAGFIIEINRFFPDMLGLYF